MYQLKKSLFAWNTRHVHMILHTLTIVEQILIPSQQILDNIMCLQSLEITLHKTQ